VWIVAVSFVFGRLVPHACRAMIFWYHVLFESSSVWDVLVGVH
jgi:hypothetical protein